MMGCSNYNSLCNISGSVVRECAVQTLPVPDARTLLNDIQEICKMPMDGCDQCGNSTSSCDTLTVYSQLCQEMSNMDACSPWHILCSYIPTWSICGGSGNRLPAMRMYFHLGIVDYLLFESLIPQTPLQYSFCIIAIFIFAFLFEGLKGLRVLLESNWRVQNQKKYTVSDSQFLLKADDTAIPPFDCKVDLLRAVIRGIELTFSYFLMLVAMTFNVGFFLAVIFGAVVGTLTFGRLHHPITPGSTSHNLNSETCH